MSGRFFKDVADKTNGHKGPYVYLVFESGGAGDCIQGAWPTEATSQRSADKLQKRSDTHGEENHYWVEKYSIQGATR